MSWLRTQRGRLISGVAIEQPELGRNRAIIAIHTYIKRNNLIQSSCYNEWSQRLGILPPFTSSKELSDYDLQRVYQAMQRDKKARQSGS